MPLLNKPLRLNYRKRRYKCQHCQKRFYEQVNFVGRYQRITLRLIEAVLARLRSNFSMSSAQKLFPYAQIVIDRFHYARNCIWAMDKVRKNLMKSLPYAKGKFLKSCKHLLLSHPNKLSEEGKMRLANVLMLDNV